MSELFSAEFFKANRERLQTLFTGTAPIVLTANGLLQKSTDSAYPFTQDGNFWYLTGINEPNVILVIDKGKEYLILPEMSETRMAFDGAINQEKISIKSGIKEILKEKEGWQKLSLRIKRAGSVAVLSPSTSFIKSLGLYTNPARKKLIKTLKKENPNITLLDLRAHLQKMRMVKQPVEIEAIRKAIFITNEALTKINKKYLKGVYKNEFEIENELNNLFYQHGGGGHSFEPIVAAGDKACTIHPQNNHKIITEKQNILLDVGAIYENYAADISRTWSLKPTKRFIDVHNSVFEVSRYAQSILKPGVFLRENEEKIEKFMGEKLRELGLIKNIKSENVRKYFPHSTSHFLGIDVHDVGDYESALEAGVVITVEPGIYIPEEGIGVRIEDDIVITQKGAENMSESLRAKL